MKLHKEITNLEIAEVLRNVAAAYQLADEKKNRFRIVAYQRAGDAVEHLSSEAKDLWDDGELSEVAGIGESIAGHLGEIFKTGKSRHFESLLGKLPPAMFELMKVPGIGVKTAYRLVDELGITSARRGLEDLKKAAKTGKIAKLEGFGEESQKAILKSIAEAGRKTEKRMLLPYAGTLAQEIAEWMKKEKSVKRVEPLGSLRRCASTVGDLDFAVASTKPERVIEHFCMYPKKSRVLEKGARTASIVLPGNRQADLMVAEPGAFGALLQHFTGSKHHNIQLREFAVKNGLSVSEYGIRKKTRIKNLKLKMQNYNSKLKIYQYKNEEDFYNALGMDWIPPELREGQGEIEAAVGGNLPSLIELKDVRADLQIHSSFDIETSHDLGLSSMEEIVEKANALGYEYLAFTEHNPSKSRHSEKQKLDILKRKREKIEEINCSIKKSAGYSIKKVFNSLEIDILPDGNLPLENIAIETLDFALVSIHSGFRQSRDVMTKRVLSGLNHPKVKIFAHPTARKLEEREGIELNWDRIFEFCRTNDKWIEINADPMRLDLPDFLVKEAIKNAVKLTLGTDSHHIDSMDNMRWGVSVARRGWARRKDIINTLPLFEIEKLIE